MTNHVLLNNVDHQHLKVDRSRSEAMGDAVMSCIAYPSEFRKLQDHYPIVFASGDVTCAMALMGLQKGENLFLSAAGWDSSYVPMAIDMQPFLIGFSGTSADQQRVIHVDMDSPRVGDHGEDIFLPMGGNSPLLDHMVSILNDVHDGHEQSPAFFSALDTHKLLEPFALDVELVDGSTGRLSGFDVINEDALNALDGTALEDLNKQGFLLPIYMAVASLSNFASLIHRKNARIAARDGGS